MSKTTRENAILPFSPDADLSGKEGYFVSIQTAGNVGAVELFSVASSLPPFGVVVYGSGPGGAASVAIAAGGLAGTVKLKLSGPVIAGQDLQLDDGGTVSGDSKSGNRTIVAQALEAGVAEELIEGVLFRPEPITVA
jgi:hypothetical protein